MPKFKKLIVTPAVHQVGRLNGTTEVEAITKDRIKEWVDNTNKLMSLGVSIPAPFAHQDEKKHFPLPVVLGTDGSSLSDAFDAYGSEAVGWDAKVNGGFWERFDVDATSGGLVGIVEAPGDATDLNTPAGKLGNTVKETSVFVMPPREVRGKDGQTHKVGEHLAHVAMCLNPREKGQKNFELLEAIPKGMELAMSFGMADMIPQGQELPDPTKAQDTELNGLLTMLRGIYVDLPETTTRETLVPNLVIALRQKLADKHETQTQEPGQNLSSNSGEVRSPAIAMSDVSDKTTEKTPILLSLVLKSYKKSLKDRVEILRQKGLSKDYAEKTLLPQIEGFVMSEDSIGTDEAIAKSPVEHVIEALEDVFKNASVMGGGILTDDNAASDGLQVEELPIALDANTDITDEQADSILAATFPIVN
jgi:hypothetical protein